MTSNEEIAAVLYRIADILEIKDVAFKPQAYRRAAQAIESYSKPIEDVASAGKLEDIPGVGKSIAEHITEMLSHKGRSLYLEKLKKTLPIDVDELFSVEGIGPKRVMILYKKLKVRDLKSLESAAKQGKIASLEGFGNLLQDKILEGIDFARRAQSRIVLARGLHMAEEIIGQLKSQSDQMAYAGSLRRGKSTIGDIDLLATSRRPKELMDSFVSLTSVEKVMLRGPTKCTVRLKGGVQCDLRVLSPEEWGSALLYFTGSKNHNIALRKSAIDRKWKLSEYGLFSGKKLVASKTEAEIYSKLGLPYIEPELREDAGEIQAGFEGKLPVLIKDSDILGDLHTHSTWSDGSASILEMAKAAKAHGLSYIAMTDHTGILKIAGGLEPKEFDKQALEVRKAQQAMNGFTILHGCEVNIDEKGNPDLPDSTLAKLDVVVGSIHHGLGNDKEKATRRLVRAIENPHIDIIGHPTGRVITRRKGYELDFPAVFDACLKHGKALEIDSQPERLDLDSSIVREAVNAGVKLSISSDSHSTDSFHFLRYGVINARRGWCQKSDVINTWDIKKLRAWLESHE